MCVVGVAVPVEEQVTLKSFKTSPKKGSKGQSIGSSVISALESNEQLEAKVRLPWE